MGVLKRRPNRFLAEVELDSGERIEAHVPDRGRLIDVLFEGTRVAVVPVDAPKRKTRFTLICARARDGESPWVCVDPAGANRLARQLIEDGTFTALSGASRIKAEVTRGRSRFDFLLEQDDPKTSTFVEVKNVGAASPDCVGMFPDAPSERAARHCRELAEMAESGGDAAIVFIAQRGDVQSIAPHPVDPDFASALEDAQSKGVRLYGAVFDVSPEGLSFLRTVEVSVRLSASPSSA